jgi:hypothetical protein
MHQEQQDKTSVDQNVGQPTGKILFEQPCLEKDIEQKDSEQDKKVLAEKCSQNTFESSNDPCRDRDVSSFRIHTDAKPP